MNRKWIAIGAIAAIIVIPVTLKLARGNTEKKVEIERVGMRVLTPSILASGALTYESQVNLTPEVSGRVKEILVDEGDVVKKDQLLMRLDPAQSLAEIAQIEAQIRQSELTIERRTVDRDAQVVKWNRNKVLKEQGLIQASAYDDVVTQKEMAEVDLRTSREMLSQTKAQLKQARERLAKTEIRSPIDGKVTAIFIKVGETAVPSVTSIAGSQLMQVADTTSVYAEVNIDETDIARVKSGAEAKIVPAAFPDTSLIGTVEQVAIWPRQATGGQNKSYPVKIRLTDTAGVTFHPGMSCRAEVLASQANGQPSIAVPVQAVKYEETDNKAAKAKTSVFIVTDGRVAKRDVETGTADDTYIEIKRGLATDEEIVIGPAKTLHFLRDGERVDAAMVMAANSTAGGTPAVQSK